MSAKGPPAHPTGALLSSAADTECCSVGLGLHLWKLLPLGALCSADNTPHPPTHPHIPSPTATVKYYLLPRRQPVIIMNNMTHNTLL